MSTQHLYLCGQLTPLPERLREAFGDVHALELPALLVRISGQAAVDCLVWLSSSDPLWPDQLRQILNLKSDARVVLISSMPAQDEGLNAFSAGARGYTHAFGVPALLQEVALVVGHGGLWIGPDLLQRLVASTSVDLAKRLSNASPPNNAWVALSVREAQVARLVFKGCSNKEVAESMFISERTVKAHLGAIFEKLGVRDRLQLALCLAASIDPVEATATEQQP